MHCRLHVLSLQATSLNSISAASKCVRPWLHAVVAEHVHQWVICSPRLVRCLLVNSVSIVDVDVTWLRL
jgi:hypothetical protein